MEKHGGSLAVYPGTFDPLTNGHISLIRRALGIFDRVVVAVAKDTPKVPLFSLEERVAMAAKTFDGDERVDVEAFAGLLVNYAQHKGATAVIRGLRAVSDFEHEFQLALMNRRLNRRIQTIFLMTDYKWLYISSTIIKEAARHGGDISGLVPDHVRERLKEKLCPPRP
jgi:pantetheine-phosphate adenylyltransferase